MNTPNNGLRITARNGDWVLVKTNTPEGYKLYYAPLNQRAAPIPNHKADPQAPSIQGTVRLSYQHGRQALESIATAFPTLDASNHDQLRTLLAFCASEKHRNALI